MLKKKKKKNLKTPHTKQKLLELINSGNLQDIKSISKIQLHFYTLTTKYQKDRLEKQSHFITASKRIKHLRINLTSQVEDLYTETCKTFKETEKGEENNKQKAIPYSWIGRINIVKISIPARELQIECKFHKNYEFN